MSQTPLETVGPADPRVDGYQRNWAKVYDFTRAGQSWSGHERNCAYLNMGAGKFANISAVSGFDFADDGRAMSLVDWDHDGDQDLWVTGRTAPRIRFLRNDSASENHFLAIRLEGTTCNRDAIGARVEVVVKDEGRRSKVEGGGRKGEGRRSKGEGGRSKGEDGRDSNFGLRPSDFARIKTLRAGEGFLSQSSKWLHFGLGRQTEIQRVVVHWPGGETESFQNLVADRHYRIRQGENKVVQWTPPQRQVDLVATKFQAPTPSGTARTVLVYRVPLPQLRPQNAGKGWEVLGQARSQPVLVNLWASWCQPCLAELKEFTNSEAAIRDAGVDLIALSVDGAVANQSTEVGAADRILGNLDFPYAVGRADAELLDKVEILFSELFGREVTFAVPCSLLLDRHGRLAAMYRGPVKVDQLLEDLRLLPLSGEPLRTAALPFSGAWVQSVDPTVNYIPTLFRAFRKLGYADDADEYLAQNATDIGSDSQHGRLLVQVGDKSLEEGNPTEAIKYYRRAIEADPELKIARYQLGSALLDQGKLTEGRKYLSQAAWREARYITRLNNEAWVLATQANPSSARAQKAVVLAELAAELAGRPHGSLLDTLSVAYAAAGQMDKAVSSSEQALELASQNKDEKSAAPIRDRLELFRRGKPYRE